MNQSIIEHFKTRESIGAYNSHLYKIHCEFCKERCIMDYGTNGTKYWRCDHHNNIIIKYLIAETDIWYTLILDLERDNRRFFISFFYDNSYMKEMFRIDEIFKAGSPASSAKTIFSLDFHPKDITPNNVADKLSLWIPFS